MKKIRHILFHLHLHISHIKCQLICGRCFVSLCSHIQMDEINGEVDYFQRIFREFPVPGTHENQFWLVCLIHLNDVEGCSAKQFGDAAAQKGCQSLWGAKCSCEILKSSRFTLAGQLFVLGWRGAAKWLSASSPAGGTWLMELDEVLHQTADVAMRMESCRAGFSADTLQHSQLWESKTQCFDPKSSEILGRLAISFTGLRCAQPCLKAFALIVSMQTITVGCFFLCVLGLVLAFLWGKILQDLRDATGMRSRGNSSFPASLIFPKPLWCFPQKSKVSRLSTFGFLAADKLRMCFGHFSWVIQSSNVSPCYPFGNFPVSISLLLGVTEEDKKPGWRERWKSRLWERDNLNKCSLLCSSVLTAWAANCRHWQVTWGCALRRAPPRLLCVCPHHFMPSSATAGNSKLPFFTAGP